MVIAKRGAVSVAVVMCLCMVGFSANGEEKNGLEEKLEKWTKSDKITLENKGYFRYWYEIQDSDVQGAGEDEPHDKLLLLCGYFLVLLVMFV